MVSVRLERDWTDGTGGTHVAGAMVEVDVSTLARLEAQGLVADPGGTESGHDWFGLIGNRAGEPGSEGDRGLPGLSSRDPGQGGGEPGRGGDRGTDRGGGGDDQDGGESWVEPTTGDPDPDSWVEPTGGRDT